MSVLRYSLKRQNNKPNKKLGIQKCLESISNSANYLSWEDFFKSHKKKDDLSDSFLQGIWFINNKMV